MTEGAKTASGVLRAGGVLDRIIESKALRLEQAKRDLPIEEIALGPGPAVNGPFHCALSRKDRLNIISEIKHRSPSKGVIRQDFDPVGIAVGYSGAGAAALSVLTEQDYFGGSLDHLRAVRSRVGLPLLRKDFIFDEYQILESKAAGADAVLLIAAVLCEDLLHALIGKARAVRLDALVEVHTAEEMRRAVDVGAQIIGVNNRDLTSFEVDLETSIRLAELAPEGAVLVSESGIKTAADIRRLRDCGYQAFLIGERLMRADYPGEALSELIDEVR